MQSSLRAGAERNPEAEGIHPLRDELVRFTIVSNQKDRRLGGRWKLSGKADPRRFELAVTVCDMPA